MISAALKDVYHGSGTRASSIGRRHHTHRTGTTVLLENRLLQQFNLGSSEKRDG